jgi:hypothetical protein
LTATAPAFVEGLDEVGAAVDIGIDRSKLSIDIERSKISIDIERSKISVDVDIDVHMRSRQCLSASNSNSSFSSTSTTPFCRDPHGLRPPPPRLAPPANAARRRISAAGSADIEEVRFDSISLIKSVVTFNLFFMVCMGKSCTLFKCFLTRGLLTKGEGSVQLTSSLR